MQTAKRLIEGKEARQTRYKDALRPVVDASTPAVELLPMLLEAPEREVTVEERGQGLGILTEHLLLEGLAHEFRQKEESALITIECRPGDYSASRIAMAVEDSGVHLTDFWSTSTEGGKVEVTLRVGCDDPTGAVHSLERYGYEVVGVYARQYGDAELAAERLMALQSYLNV